MTLKDRKGGLENQKLVLREQYIKVIGAIELIEVLIKEEDEHAKKEKSKKKD